MMTSTRITATLVTAAVAVPLLSRQIATAEIIHCRVGRNKNLTRFQW